MEKKGPNRLVGVFSVPGKEKQLVDVSEIQYDYVTEVFIRTAAYRLLEMPSQSRSTSEQFEATGGFTMSKTISGLSGLWACW